MKKQRLTEIDNKPTKTAWFDRNTAYHLFTIPGPQSGRELLYTNTKYFVVAVDDIHYAFMTAGLLINFLITDSKDSMHDMLMDKIAEVYDAYALAAKQRSDNEKAVMITKRDAVEKLKVFFENEEY